MKTNAEAAKCKCGGELCLSCSVHLNGEIGGICLLCLAVDASDLGVLANEDKERLTDAIETLERRSSGCPNCSNGMSCAPLCESCSEEEMHSEMEHERAHSAGRLG